MSSDLNSLKQTISQAFSLARSADVEQPIDLARLGTFLVQVDETFSPHKYGAEKLRPLLEKVSDVVQVVKDDSIYPPRYFVTHLTSGAERPVIATILGDSNASKASAPITLMRQSTQTSPAKLNEFAFIHSDKWTRLAELARPEPWGDDKDPHFYLKNYVRHTYSRLVYEDKVKVCGEMAAFNTGLVDRRFQPVYALLKTNERGAPPWFLDSFCVAGENFAGKQLVKIFRELPEAAYYFNNPADIFFDVNAQIYTDWEHIIEENIDRIPVELLKRTTQDFNVKSCNGMTEEEIDEYKDEVAAYLKKDDFAYRMIMDAFRRAMDLALKKVRWNYKTAIPVYYSSRNKLHMLLPLCLISEERVDVALVVERTDSGNYQAHTIYPLEWAYTNSRLIARPESEWLRASAK
ncbi:DUF3825 domain-containing protein [Pseudoduganella sp. OTU4001]|uniref:DUF3825 domain-containing protein n=1 Tax=Pseudoduganella sp. OTU4001 TaxID=3043854 RepID=UPI00313B0E63